MEYDQKKVDDAALALLCLTMWGNGTQTRAWKGHSLDVLDRLYRNGYISDPRRKARSVVITDKGVVQAEELFRQLFGIAG